MPMYNAYGNLYPDSKAEQTLSTAGIACSCIAKGLDMHEIIIRGMYVCIHTPMSV